MLRPLSRSTAQQLASDIRRSHRRNGKGVARAVLDGERWEATWGEVEGEHFVWIRLVVEEGSEG